MACAIRHFYGDDPWELSWGQWETRLRGIKTISSAESGQIDHAHRAQQIARDARMDDVRERAFKTHCRA